MLPIPQGPAIRFPRPFRHATPMIMVVGVNDDELVFFKSRQARITTRPKDQTYKIEHAIHIPSDVGAVIILRYNLEGKEPDRLYGIARSAGRSDLNIAYADSFNQLSEDIELLLSGRAHLSPEERNKALTRPPVLTAPVVPQPPPAVASNGKGFHPERVLPLTPKPFPGLKEYLDTHEVDLKEDAGSLALKLEPALRAGGYTKNGKAYTVAITKAELQEIQAARRAAELIAQSAQAFDNLLFEEVKKLNPDLSGDLNQTISVLADALRVRGVLTEIDPEVLDEINSILTHLRSGNALAISTPVAGSKPQPKPDQNQQPGPTGARPATKQDEKGLMQLLKDHGADPSADRGMEGLRMQEVLAEKIGIRFNVQAVKLRLFHLSRMTSADGVPEAPKKESAPKRPVGRPPSSARAPVGLVEQKKSTNATPTPTGPETLNDLVAKLLTRLEEDHNTTIDALNKNHARQKAALEEFARNMADREARAEARGLEKAKSEFQVFLERIGKQ